ncbi:MAG: bifunctional glutamate N-acetyltransferase/amino-acid acetyltransferase ArgJ [Methylococcaceae bacterium]|nr:bifunctional glutamate N-acetyltransferase/amino-acid acetyltransferase ArgJ [Methylococcaceae bacterium]
MSSAGLRVSGIRLGATGAGIKRTDRDDLLVIELAAGGTLAAVFTRNAFCAAPVVVAREHLGQAPRWLLINSGNANAGTGARGLDDARESCRRLAALVGGADSQVLPFSTGVIGEYLPLDKIAAALPGALTALDEQGWERAARAIMTTDTRPKIASRELAVDGQSVSVVGIAKGAGMIHPDMATMLSFVAADAAVEAGALQQVLDEAVDQSFNCITVDGDTSTNDACVLMASGRSAELAPGRPGWDEFRRAVLEVCGELAEAIIRDGEGATKLIRIDVREARARVEALAVGKTIAHSPLVKTAFFASDPNWGRILAAIGRAGCPELDIARVSVFLGDVRIVEGGGRAGAYTEAAGQAEMAKPEITVGVRLGRGQASAEVLTCDFSYDYVRINAEYRT